MPPADLPPPTPDPRGAIVRNAVPALTTGEHPESPKAPSAGWRGILLKSADAMRANPAGPPVIARVFHRIPRPQWPADKKFELVVIESGSRKEHRFPIGVSDASPDEPPPPPPPEKKIDPKVAERLVVEGYLNINLTATIVPPLPPGNYALRIELGPLKSNEAALRIVP